MRFVRRDAPSPRGVAAGMGREEASYVLLEEARLLCEGLCCQCGQVEARGILNTLHREFGLAGFFASSNLSAQRRQRLLDDARCRARDHGSSARRIITALRGLTRESLRAIEAAPGAEGFTDNMHLAHVHLLGAQELLRAAQNDDLLERVGDRRSASAPR